MYPTKANIAKKKFIAFRSELALVFFDTSYMKLDSMSRDIVHKIAVMERDSMIDREFNRDFNDLLPSEKVVAMDMLEIGGYWV